MKPVRADGRERREVILDAALRCFVDKGVAATGIEDVRRAALASPSSMYHQFKGMEELKLALLTRTFADLFAHLRESVCRSRTAKGAVTRLVRAHIDWVLAHPDEARVMYQAMSLELRSDVADELQAEKAAMLTPIVSHVSRFVADGSLPPWSPVQLDVALLGATHEACRRFLAGAPIDASWMRNTLPRLAYKSLT